MTFLKEGTNVDGSGSTPNVEIDRKGLRVRNDNKDNNKIACSQTSTDTTDIDDLNDDTENCELLKPSISTERIDNVRTKVAEDIVCKQCHKHFATKQSLATHTKTALYCTQKKKSKKVFECQYCHKVLSSKQMMLYHDSICTTKKQFEYDRKIQEMEKLVNYARVKEENILHGNQFRQMSNIIKCDVGTNAYMKLPNKVSSCLYEVFPFLNEKCILSRMSKRIIPLGLKLDIPFGISVELHGITAFQGILTHESMGLYIFSKYFVEDHYKNQSLFIVAWNTTEEDIIIDPLKPIAMLLIRRFDDMNDVHIQFTRRPSQCITTSTTFCT